MSILPDKITAVRVHDGVLKEGALFWHPTRGEVQARTVDKLATNRDPMVGMGDPKVWIVSDNELIDPYAAFVCRKAALAAHKRQLEHLLTQRQAEAKVLQASLERIAQELQMAQPAGLSPEKEIA